MAQQLAAQDDYSMKSFVATVEGTSSLRDWKSHITSIEYAGTIQLMDKSIKTFKNVEIKIPVSGIKGKEGKTMDTKTYQAFNAHKNPYILFSLTASQVTPHLKQTSVIEAWGNLVMNGTMLPITLKVIGKVLPNGDIQIFFRKEINMTEFKMKPPSAVLGTINVNDEVFVNFALLLTKKLTVGGLN